MGLIFLIYFKVNLRFILKAKNKDKAKFYSLKLSLIFWGHIPAHRACLLLNKGNNFDIDFVEFFSLEIQTTNFFLIKGKVFWNLRECFTLFYFKFNFFDTSSHKQRLIATFYSLRFSLIFWGHIQMCIEHICYLTKLISIFSYWFYWNFLAGKPTTSWLKENLFEIRENLIHLSRIFLFFLNRWTISNLLRIKKFHLLKDKKY